MPKALKLPRRHPIDFFPPPSPDPHPWWRDLSYYYAFRQSRVLQIRPRCSLLPSICHKKSVMVSRQITVTIILITPKTDVIFMFNAKTYMQYTENNVGYTCIKCILELPHNDCSINVWSTSSGAAMGNPANFCMVAFFVFLQMTKLYLARMRHDAVRAFDSKNGVVL